MTGPLEARPAGAGPITGRPVPALGGQQTSEGDNEGRQGSTVGDRIHPPAGIAVAPGGIAVVGVGLLENLVKSRTLPTYLALIFVRAFLGLRLRSVIRSLLSLIPVLVAVGSSGRAGDPVTA